MAGRDDLRILSAFVYSKLRGSKFDKEDMAPVAATVMNRATAVGSLADAVQSMSPTPDMMEVIQGNIRGREQKEYKRVIQMSSKLLKGFSDPTGGATDFLPKRSKVGKAQGLVKTHGTKNYNFYKRASTTLDPGRVQTL